MIISDRLDRENDSKTERKDERVFKKRAAIFERELNKALNELHEFKMRLNEAGVDIITPLDTKQQKEIERLSRTRKKEVDDQLPPLPVSKPKKTNTPKKAFTRRNQTNSTLSPSTKATVNTSQIVEQEHNTNSGMQAESLREKPHETGGKVSQSPEKGMAVTPKNTSSSEQQLKTASTVNQADNDTTSTIATSLTSSNEIVPVQIDIDAPSADTSHEELITHKVEHSKLPVTPGKSLDESSLKASSNTIPEQVSAMTTTQDTSSTTPTLQELAARVRSAIDAGAQDKGTGDNNVEPVDNRQEWEKNREKMRAIIRRDSKR
ncbi:hypothetical protein D9M69_434290 [compost metagenome]